MSRPLNHRPHPGPGRLALSIGLCLLALGLPGPGLYAEPAPEAAPEAREATPTSPKPKARTAPASAAPAAARSDDGDDSDDSDDGGEPPRPFTRQEPKPLPQLAEDGGPGERVLIVPIKGTIEPGLVPFIQRSLREHPGVKVIIFEVDTFGGRVDSATEIRDLLLSLKVPTVAYVHRRAISAGALISLAADYLVFSAGASMGAATPVQMAGGGEAKPVGEKMVSYMRAEMRATAEAKGRNGDLAEAMVDADVAIEGVIRRGKLLTVTADLADTLGLASGRFESSRELIEALGLGRADVSQPTENWAEKVARFLTSPAVAGVLMLIGMLGLYMELSTPGVGLPGLVGLLALGAFFGGHMVVALAGWEEVALFALALGLLALEVFVIPGFGVAGVAGFALLGVSLVMAMMNLPVSVAWDSGVITSALSTVMLALVGSVILFFFALKYLPEARFARGLTLRTTLGDPVEVGGAAYLSAPEDWGALLGRKGVAHTPLRPSGKARIDDALVDVVSRMDWIDRGTPVRVVEVEGVRIVVVRDAGDGATAPVEEA